MRETRDGILDGGPVQWEQNAEPHEVEIDPCSFTYVEMSGDTGYVVFTTGGGTIDG